MKTITEDYVSFETAKLLKKKGFDADISIPHAVYSLNDGTFINLLQFIGNTSFINYNLEKCVVAPTIQMAMKWLREVHNLHVDSSIYTDTDGDSEHEYTYTYWDWLIFNSESGRRIAEPQIGCGRYDSYEQANEAAIKYCLENLM